MGVRGEGGGGRGEGVYVCGCVRGEGGGGGVRVCTLTWRSCCALYECGRSLSEPVLCSVNSGGGGGNHTKQSHKQLQLTDSWVQWYGELFELCEGGTESHVEMSRVQQQIQNGQCGTRILDHLGRVGRGE